MPLSSMISKQAECNWRKEYQKALATIKNLVSRESILSYPSFNELFEIQTDESKEQLGSVISQKGKFIAFYSRKKQVNYATTERELLFIMETIRELRNML